MGSGLKAKVNIFQSKDDRDIILLEAANDPAFEAQLSSALDSPSGEQDITISAHRAILNEINPDLYPETAGTWPVLRSILAEVMSKAAASTAAKAADIPMPTGAGVLGQWDILGPIISAVAGAGASIYTAQLQSSTAKTIANEQMQANMQEIQAQEALANAQKAIANAQTTQAIQQVLPPALATPVAGVINTLTQPVAGGMQLWEILLIGYFVLKSTKN